MTEVGSLQSFIVQDYTENANRKCVIFLVSLSSGCGHVLSLYFLFYGDNVNQLHSLTRDQNRF